MDYPAIDFRKASANLKFTDTDAMKMLINLLGDLHQPMHVGFVGDDAGRKTRVRFEGKEMSLYDFWDKTISETVRNQESNFWLGGWTHVGRIKDKFEEDQKLWKEDGAFKSFERWSTESAKFACEFAYIHPVTKQKLGGPDAPNGVVDIDRTAYMKYREEFLRLLLVAGERTAIVLNDILDAKEAAKLKEGSQVITDADKKEEETKKEWAKEREKRMKFERDHAPGSSSEGAIWKNLLISAITVPSFLYCVNFGIDPRNVAALIESLSASAPSVGGSGGGGKRGE
jgi:hypothetical protein